MLSPPSGSVACAGVGSDGSRPTADRGALSTRTFDIQALCRGIWIVSRMGYWPTIGYAARRRRRAIPRPTKLTPNTARVAGSGKTKSLVKPKSNAFGPTVKLSVTVKNA